MSPSAGEPRDVMLTLAEPLGVNTTNSLVVSLAPYAANATLSVITRDGAIPAFLANAALINVVGFPLSGMILFWGSAYALGSRNTARDPLIAAVLSVVTYVLFNQLLGVPLPGGPLMGVL